MRDILYEFETSNYNRENIKIFSLDMHHIKLVSRVIFLIAWTLVFKEL